MRFREGDWYLVDAAFDGKRQVWARKNPDGSTTYRTDYAVDPLVDMNTAQRNMARKDWTGDYHMIASVPAHLATGEGYFAQALRQKDDKAMSKWLNDSDNRAWRTKDGTV